MNEEDESTQLICLKIIFNLTDSTIIFEYVYFVIHHFCLKIHKATINIFYTKTNKIKTKKKNIFRVFEKCSYEACRTLIDFFCLILNAGRGRG